MKDGFIKVAAVTPKIRVADTTYNGELIRELMEETVEKGDSDTVRDERTRLSVGLYQVRILSYIVGKLSEV